MDLNKVLIVGRVGSEPLSDKTDAGDLRVRFRVATTTRHGAASERRTQWHDIVVVGDLAKRCADNLKAGVLVYVEGQLRGDAGSILARDVIMAG